MRITLNLATRPFTDLGPPLKRLRIAMAVLVALCLLFFLGLHLFDRQAAAARARDHSLDGEIARVQAERAAAAALMSRPDNAQLLKQADFLNQRFDEKAFSWTLAMEAMETVLPGGVQVNSIEPLRDKDGHITVHVRVVGPRDRADELVSNLERSRRFLQPRIVGENAESGNGPSRNLEPISASNRFDFDLLADYNPPTPEERASLRRTARASAKVSSAVPLGIANPKRSRPGPGTPQQPGRQPYVAPSSSSPPASGPKAFYRNPTPGGPQ
jgi:type IV pilus assembly protein PilN